MINSTLVCSRSIPHLTLKYITAIFIVSMPVLSIADEYFMPPPNSTIQPTLPISEEDRVDQVEAVIPPHPGNTGGAGIGGSDVDGDGIRDDIELYIYSLKSSDADLTIYGKETDFNNKYLRNSLYNIAYYYRNLLLTPANSSGQYVPSSVVYKESYFVSKKCLANRVGLKTDKTTLINKIDNLMLNSFDRLSKYYQVQSGLKQIVSSADSQYQNQFRQNHTGSINGQKYDVYGFPGCAGNPPENIIE